MNTFNRIVLIILALAVLVAGFCVTVWPAWWLWVGENMYNYSQYSRLGYTLVMVLVMLVSGLILLLEVRRPRRAKYVVVDRVAGGQARVLVESVARRLNYEVDLLQDVSDVKSQILAKGKGLRVRLDVLMSPDVDIPMKTDEVIETARRVIEEQMGLKLAGKAKDAIMVHIRHPKKLAPKPAPLPAVTPSASAAPAELAEAEAPAWPEVEEPAVTVEEAPAEEWPSSGPEEEDKEGWSETL